MNRKVKLVISISLILSIVVLLSSQITTNAQYYNQGNGWSFGSWSFGRNVQISNNWQIGGNPLLTSTLNLGQGWNMVSFSVIPTNENFSSILNGYTYQVFTWDGTKYVSATSLVVGQAYWIWITSNSIVTVTGIPVNIYNLNLQSGWTMVGGHYGSIINMNTAISDSYTMYRWDGSSYVASSTIVPDNGYWVFVGNATNLNV